MSLVLLDRPTPGVAVITLNRPERLNALTPDLLAEFDAQLSAAGQDEGVRAIVLTGSGRAFCAGLDLDAVGTGAAFGPADILPLTQCPLPVVGAINGAAVTGGLELALACDFRIASTNARFADTHSRVGVIPGWGLTARLPQAVGEGWARRMSFTGDFVDAPTAARIGLVTEVVEPPGLIDRAVELAASIGSTDRATLDAVRGIYDQARDGTGADALKREAEYARQGFHMSDPDGFAERRAALFARGRKAVR